ncbi:MAG: PIN domain-containing protein [Deltaproteobacteria bacterium]|nr:PIN domain-containing protein [Deltaproteobacteria bacterium]
MKSDCFIDTNIWVYALLEASNSDVRQQTALSLLQNLPATASIMVSTQVINEFHWTLARKYRLADDVIQDKAINGIVAFASTVLPLELVTYLQASEIRKRHNLSFWDSLIVASALQSGCTTLYSEDMSHGTTIEKRLHIVNPFH